MNDTTKTDILKYILNIEEQLQELKNILHLPPLKENFARENKEISLFNNNGSLYNVFSEIDEIIDYYINNIGFPNMGKQISQNNIKFKTIKFFEKYSLNSSMSLKIINSLEFEKNISYDKYLSIIETKIKIK